VKVKLDENIPVSLAEALASLGHDVQTVVGQGLTGRADAEIWRQCQLEDRLLIASVRSVKHAVVSLGVQRKRDTDTPSRSVK
jgi:predicted nuclease of predicted toxin-antitoxin system